MPNPNDIVRLKKPKTVTASGKPEAFVVTVNGEIYNLPWGADFRLSGHTDPENNVGNMSASGGYRLLHTSFYQKHKSQFTTINKKED